MDLNYIGKLLDGRYEILSLIGVGGMSNVYKAIDKKTGATVAVKFLKQEFYTNEELVRRFKNESKAIYYKNFRNLYPLTEDMLDKMAKYSEFPKPLLEKLAKFYPEADRDLFFEKCEQMHNIRVQAIEQQKRIKENM